MNRKQAKIEALILTVATLQQAQAAGLAANCIGDERDYPKVEEEIDGIIDQLQSRLERLRETEVS